MIHVIERKRARSAAGRQAIDFVVDRGVLLDGEVRRWGDVTPRAFRSRYYVVVRANQKYSRRLAAEATPAEARCRAAPRVSVMRDHQRRPARVDPARIVRPRRSFPGAASRQRPV